MSRANEKSKKAKLDSLLAVMYPPRKDGRASYALRQNRNGGQSDALKDSLAAHTHVPSVLPAQAEMFANTGFRFSVERRNERFAEGLGYLEAYRKEHGDVNVPINYSTDDFRLGSWVMARRRDYKCGRLKPERIEALIRLGFQWTAKRGATSKLGSFSDGIGYLEVYRKEHGHVRVPITYSVDGFHLGKWLVAQRGYFRRGLLSPDQTEAFIQAGVKLNVLRPEPVLRGGALKYLRAFVRTYGHANVPVHFVAKDGFRLGTWCKRQVRAYNAGRLSPARIAKFAAIGFSWDWPDTRETRYRVGLAHLKAYIEEFGSADVPVSYVVNGFNLGQWCVSRRRSQAQGHLAASKFDELEAMGFRWSIPRRRRNPDAEQPGVGASPE